MREDLVRKVAQQYGLRLKSVQPVQKGYRNESYALTLQGGTTRNLILYKSEPGMLAKIQNANYVADFLAQAGFPARQTADTRIVCLKAAHTTSYTALYNYLPGTTIPWEAYTMEHIKQLGATMGDMHQRLSLLKRGGLPLVSDECLGLCQRMQTYFDQTGVRQALVAKLGIEPALDIQIYKQVTGRLGQTGNPQALHMDFVRGNVLFGVAKPAKVTGVLDFEKTGWGPPVFDVARTLAFLLVDCKYKPAAKVRKYFVQSGYVKRGWGSPVDSTTLEQLVDFFLLHDFYKFLLHNPYEYLPQNEHFRRTCCFLLQRQLIRQARNSYIHPA